MNLFKSFNQSDTTVVVTSFPNPTDSQKGNKGFNAVGWHSKKTLVELSQTSPVLVLAEKRSGRKQFTIGSNLAVKRTWKKGSIPSLLALVSTILSLKKVKSVFLQFEFNVFGGILPNLTLLLVIALLRLSGKRVTFELHQVITDIRLLVKHVPITNPLLQVIFNMGLKVFYTVLGLLANDIIVFEEILKERLSHFVKEEKINVLSLSVEKKQTTNKQLARKTVNQALSLPSGKRLKSSEFIVLVFGFINGYKGIDWIIDALKDKQIPQGSEIRLLIAGGMNPYLKDQKHYQNFYHSIVDEAQKHANITYSGFVPDEMVKEYFSASDVVVLPYEVCMSASGPFSLALSYGKPVILSEKLSPYAKSVDVKDALTSAGLSQSDLFFKLQTSAVMTTLSALDTPEMYKRYMTFSKSLAQMRESKRVVRRLHRILHPTPSIISIPAARLPKAVAFTSASSQN